MKQILINSKLHSLNLNTYWWYIILFLYCINFMSMGYIIPLTILPVVFFYLLNNKFNQEFLVVFACLLIFSVFYTMMLYLYNLGPIDSIIGKLIYPSCLFVLGYKLATGDTSYKKTITFFYVIITAFTLYAFMSVVNTIYLFGSISNYVSIYGRSVLSVWDDSIISATALNTFFSLGLVLMPLIFLSRKGVESSRLIKVLSLALFSVSFFSTIQLSNRTGLVLVIASFFIVILFVKKVKLREVINLFGLALFIFFLSMLYNLNVLGIKVFWENTALYLRMSSTDLSEDPRIAAWKASFLGLFENPLGGRSTELQVSYAHNLWLDIALDGGVIPFIFLVVFTLMSAFTIYIFIKSKHPLFLKGLVISMYTAFLLCFAVEPILQGMTAYFTIFCFFFGVILRLNTDYRLNKHIEKA